MKTLNVAIIGQGRSGRNIHGSHLITVPQQYHIAAVADPLEDRRKRAAAEYHCDTYPDHRDILKRRDIDLVVNSTPSHLHVPISLEFLKAGFNVLSEKPMARTVAEVDRLIRAAKKSGVVLSAYQQARYGPFLDQMRKVIASGLLGRIIQINMNYNGFGRRWDWQTLQEFNGGNLMNTGPHPLDMCLILYGEGMPQVFCHMEHTPLSFGDAEDHVKLILRGEGHPLIDIEISSCCPYPAIRYNVYGTQGGMKGTMEELEWTWYVPSEAPPQKLSRAPICAPDGTPVYCDENLPMHKDSWKVTDQFKNIFQAGATRLYEMLYKTLTAGAPLEVTPEQIRRQVAVYEECRKQNPWVYKERETRD